MKNIYQNESDLITISPTVLSKIVQEVIMENKNMFKDKSHLKLKNDKTIVIDIVEKDVIVSIDVNVKYGKNIKKLGETLQREVKLMIEHITDYKIAQININFVGVEV